MPTNPRRAIRLIALLGAACFSPSTVIAQNDGWATGTPESAGLDPARLAALTAAARGGAYPGIHAILIQRGGRLVYEEYFKAPDQRWGTSLGSITMDRSTLHDLRSVTKSVVSALVGIAVGEGAIKSLDQPVVEWFPEYAELNTTERRRVTLAHVLGMTAGLEWDEDIPYSDPRNYEIRMTRDSAPLRFALSQPFVRAPGEDWTYSGGLVQVMAAVLERATKQPIEQYARTKLFAPLGIDTVEWVGDLAGMPAAASGLRLRARDLAKFGSLFLSSGRWHEKQVVPVSWVASSTRRQFAFRAQPTDSGGRRGYGHFWWYYCLPGEIEVRAAVGNGQQRVFVVPGLDLVVTIFAGRYNDATARTLADGILRNHVLPAVRTGINPGCPGA